MTDLRLLEAIGQQDEQQQAQQSPLMQKAAESMAEQQKQEPLEPDLQAMLQGMQNEREAVQTKQDLHRGMALQQLYGCGGCIKHADGGGIHIAPSKRGTFTAAASRHGMGVQEFASRVLAHKENYSPAMVKKANFARNASKWHGYGGPLNTFASGGMLESILSRYGVNYRVTSGYRGPNSKVGKLGGKSAHARLLDDGSSAAIDIVPGKGSDFDTLALQLSNPQLQAELAAHGFGILDETDPATMRKTGATGKHFHVGMGIKGGGFNIGGYHSQVPISMQTAIHPYRDGYAQMPEEPVEDTSFTPWWADGPAAGQSTPWWVDVSSVPSAAEAARQFAKGGFMARQFGDAATMIKAHEGFSPTAYKDGNSQSIGYGFYKHGMAQGIDFNKRMSRQEADAILASNIAQIDGELRRELGAEKYNSLTKGQRAAIIDTWYQSPKIGKKAARVYKQTGDLKKTADALAVKGFGERNADRRATFFGNGDLVDPIAGTQTPSAGVYQSNMSMSSYGEPDAIVGQDAQFTPWWMVQRPVAINTVSETKEKKSQSDPASVFTLPYIF